MDAPAAGAATVGPPPGITAETEPFWAAAERGVLVVERCVRCGAHRHPPCGVCAECGSRDVEFEAVAGTGVVHGFTVNHHPWWPGLEVPYVLVLVEFPVYGVRVLGRMRGAGEGVHIGMAATIGFEPGPGGCTIPSFVPVTDDGGDAEPV